MFDRPTSSSSRRYCLSRFLCAGFSRSRGSRWCCRNDPSVSNNTRVVSHFTLTSLRSPGILRITCTPRGTEKGARLSRSAAKDHPGNGLPRRERAAATRSQGFTSFVALGFMLFASGGQVRVFGSFALRLRRRTVADEVSTHLSANLLRAFGNDTCLLGGIGPLKARVRHRIQAILEPSGGVEDHRHVSPRPRTDPEPNLRGA